jgi:hypothetical protein|tara:strand:+ start:567 stop:758 length:192 start_codon:yes stop_codon:yes gene_type:complete
MIDSKYSTYVDGIKRADVIKKNGDWGCKFYSDNELVKVELYPTKSEAWAESAAENYVMGVKQI